MTELGTTLVLTTFDDTNKHIKVSIQGDSVFAEDLVRKAGKILRLQDSSLKYFGIFQGLNTPTRKFSCVDRIPASTEGLTFQKWCFDIKEEKRVLFKDPSAMQLLCAQSSAEIRNGKLIPTTEQMVKLQEHSDPSFPVPMPYITECQSIPGYNSICIKECVLFQAFHLQSLQIPEGTSLVLSAAKRGLVLQVDKEEYFLSWRKIRRWSRAEDDINVTIVVYSIPSDSYIDLCIQSDQAPYLVAVIMEMIKLMQTDLKGPVFQTTDLIRNKQRQIIEWNNITFSATRFNAEKELAENYIDISTVT